MGFGIRSPSPLKKKIHQHFPKQKNFVFLSKKKRFFEKRVYKHTKREQKNVLRNSAECLVKTKSSNGILCMLPCATHYFLLSQVKKLRHSRGLIVFFERAERMTP